MRSRCSRQPILLLAGLLLFTSSASDWYAQSNGDQQPSTGPNPDVGPTVLAPKKTQPAPPETEKKPERINPNEIFTLSTATNLVNVDVMVLDKDGNPLSNLSRKNFKIHDDGVPQTVSNFGTSEAPMTTCMLIEFSNRYWAFLYLALRYAYSYVQFIQPKDWTAVVSFDLKPQILTDFTQDRSQVRRGAGYVANPRLQRDLRVRCSCLHAGSHERREREKGHPPHLYRLRYVQQADLRSDIEDREIL